MHLGGYWNNHRRHIPVMAKVHVSGCGGHFMECAPIGFMAF